MTRRGLFGALGGLLCGSALEEPTPSYQALGLTPPPITEDHAAQVLARIEWRIGDHHRRMAAIGGRDMQTITIGADGEITIHGVTRIVSENKGITWTKRAA